MELLQNYVPGRTTSLSDLATNTIGAAGGALLALLLAPALVPYLRGQARRASPGAVLLLACWGAYQLYPFFPVIRSTRLRQAIQALFVAHAFSPVEIWRAGAEWFAAAVALEAVVGRLRTPWAAGALLVLSLRIFMPGRTLGAEEVAGGVLALLAWELLPAKRRIGIGVWMTLSAIVLAELAPFHFTRHAAAFSWIPLGASFEYDRWAALVTLLRKSFLYGAAVWLVARSGVRYPVAGGALAAALLTLELAQRYLPGRTPEITDSLIALVMTAALWALSDWRTARAVE